MCLLTRGVAVCAGPGTVGSPGACSAPLRPPGVDLCGQPPAEDLLPTTYILFDADKCICHQLRLGVPAPGFRERPVSPDHLITVSRTGLLPQEPRELWPSFPQDPALCRAPFWHEPALLSHGKRSPPVFFSKKCRGHKIAFSPRKRHFFQAKKR